MFLYRLSAEASDHLIEKQLTAYSSLVDTAEEKGGCMTVSGPVNAWYIYPVHNQVSGQVWDVFISYFDCEVQLWQLH